VFNIGKTARLRTGMKKIQETVLAQSVKFAENISQEVDDKAGTIELIKFNRISHSFVSDESNDWNANIYQDKKLRTYYTRRLAT
jgi:hypothetical protein